MIQCKQCQFAAVAVKPDPAGFRCRLNPRQVYLTPIGVKWEFPLMELDDGCGQGELPAIVAPGPCGSADALVELFEKGGAKMVDTPMNPPGESPKPKRTRRKKVK